MNNVATRTVVRISLTVALALLLITPVGAQGSDQSADARCLAAMSMTQDQAGKTDKNSFDSAMMFFLGKMIGRGGLKSVAPALEAAAAGMTENRAAKLASTCADEMSRAGDAM